MTVRYYSSVAAETTLVGSITNSSTTVQLASVVGLPALTPYTIALDYEGVSEELVEVTAAAGTTLTVTRAIDGTSATSHNTGARVRHVSSARDFSDSRSHENNTTGVHGLAGGEAVVGVSSAQTLSNKTLNNATGTLNRIDIFSEGGTSWVTTVNGDIDFAVDLMKWYRGPSEPHHVAGIKNNGSLFIQNQDSAADSVTTTYRLQAVKNDGTTDIFSVRQGGQVTTSTDSGQAGFMVKPRSSTDNKAISVRNVADSADTFVAYGDGRVAITGQTAANPQLSVTGAAGQSTDYVRVLTSAAASVWKIDSTQKMTVNGAADIRNDSNTGGVGTVVLQVHGRQTGQTGDLQQWFDGNGNQVANIDNLGRAEFAQSTASGASVLTAASGWSVAAGTFAVKKAGMICIRGVLTRTGADMPASSTGNIGDVAVCTVAAAWRPDSAFGSDRMTWAYGTGVTSGSIGLNGSTGDISVLDANSNSTITNGSSFRFMLNYPA